MAGDDPVAEDVDGGCGFWALLGWKWLFWRMLGGEHGDQVCADAAVGIALISPLPRNHVLTVIVGFSCGVVIPADDGSNFPVRLVHSQNVRTYSPDQRLVQWNCSIGPPVKSARYSVRVTG